VFRRTEPPRIARLAPLVVAAPVGTLTLLRELTGVSDASTTPIEAAFQHPPPANAARYQEVLGCPVHFNADELRLVIPRAVFDRPLRRADEQLFDYLERHAQALLERAVERDTASALVRQTLCARLREGEPRQGDVARALALSERTLQRRLTEEGTSFAAILDEIRAELARMYLGDPNLAVFEVAYLVGYSEPSAFVRAFRRWTGTNPREYRQRQSPS
jgi:AraC-like DNA-binding protein